VKAVLSAGALQSTMSGTVDLVHQSVSVDFAMTAPAMKPRADVSWQSVAINAHVAGAFTSPNATAHLAVADLAAGGAAIAGVSADVSGTRGEVDLRAALTGTRLPGPHADLFEKAPIQINANVALQDARRPVRFTLDHPLLSIKGTVSTQGAITAHLRTSIPDIAPLAALGNADIRGPLKTTAEFTRRGDEIDAAISGDADFNGGQRPIPTLFGKTTFAAAASLNGQDITVRQVSVDGHAIHADLAGTDIDRRLDFTWHLALPELAAAAPGVVGALTASGHVGGAERGVSVQATIEGQVGGARFAKGPVRLTVQADGLPRAPHAVVDGQGKVAGGPFVLQSTVETLPDGAVRVRLSHAGWKTLLATADMTLPKGASIPSGKAAFSIARLADFDAFVAGAAGSLHGTAALSPNAEDVGVDGQDLALGAQRIAKLALTVKGAGPIDDPAIAGNLSADGIDAGGLLGHAKLTARGKLPSLNLSSQLALQNLQGAPATLSVNAVLNARAKTVAVSALKADWKTLALRQTGSARVEFGQRVAVNTFDVGVGHARLTLAGQITPSLDLTASLQNVTPELARPFAPGLDAVGTLSADARLMGTAASPNGRVRVSADGVRMRRGTGAALPAAQLRATALLSGRTATVDVHLNAGRNISVTASGTVPLQPDGPLHVNAAGKADVAALNPILEAAGRSATGTAQFNVSASGSATAPRVTGSVILAHGEVQDFTQGLRLTNIAADIEATGTAVQISKFTATAGAGTIALTGRVGAFEPGHPVDLRMTAHQAKPLASDLLTAVFDSDISVTGSADSSLQAAGTVLLRHVDINIPDSLPPSVAVLHVRKPGDRPPAAAGSAPPALQVHLNIAVDAPSNIFVRGKGLDAELGGKLTVTGTAASPLIAGGFDMRRGNFSLAGTTLDFTKGMVSFNGAGPTGGIDPTLNFEADSYQGGITATLKVTGYADAPKIALSSVPDLPQDEVLAHLLFGESLKQLSPLQIAEIGAALAELSGLTGSGGPLSSIRKGLGLDRLSVGGGTNGAGATVEAGRYVAKGVYVGAKQAAGGAGGTQAQVQVDLTRHLKLQTTLGTGGTAQGATPQNDPGSSVGLSYQFEY
jgi:translocation and assembly module TamB